MLVDAPLSLYKTCANRRSNRRILARLSLNGRIVTSDIVV
jgi:hypothetical protein